MHYMLDTSPYSFQVTRAAEARKDFGKDVQKVDRDTGQPQWVVELLAQDADRGEVIRVTVTFPGLRGVAPCGCQWSSLASSAWADPGDAEGGDRGRGAVL